MKRWNDDPFTKKAHRENFEARSVYKLEEIDRRERILGNAHLIIDLGASPGSWTQYCLKKAPTAQIVAVDLNPLNFKDVRVQFLQEDINTIRWEEILEGKKADVVLSDMAPKTSGIHDQDVARSFDLASLALEVALRNLKGDGRFVVKIFMGDTFEEFGEKMAAAFKEVKRLRPETTRKHSREIYFIGKRLKFSPEAAPTSER